jgi:transposase
MLSSWGDVSRACRYFGIGRASFYRWKTAFQKQDEAGLANKKPIPKNPANQTRPEIAEKVVHLRQTYHLGPVRIVWYLARYHGIKISDAGVYRIYGGVGSAGSRGEHGFERFIQPGIRSRFPATRSRSM